MRLEGRGMRTNSWDDGSDRGTYAFEARRRDIVGGVATACGLEKEERGRQREAGANIRSSTGDVTNSTGNDPEILVSHDKVRSEDFRRRGRRPGPNGELLKRRYRTPRSRRRSWGRKGIGPTRLSPAGWRRTVSR